MDIAVLQTETDHLLLTAPAKGGLQHLEDQALQAEPRVGVMSSRYPLLAGLSVAENIALPGMYHRNLALEQVLERLAGPVEALDMGRALGQRPENLSHEEAFKARLLRCLGQDSGIILLPSPHVREVARALRAVEALDGNLRLWIACLDKAAPAYSLFGLKPIDLEGQS